MSITWENPPQHLQLQRHAVHIWRASLDMDLSQAARWGPILSAEEQTRARRFHFPEDSGHFVAAHRILRMLLGRYLDQEPGSLRFATNAYGKPRLEAAPGRPALSFNLSHSSRTALIAITLGREVGVDLEWTRPLAVEPLLEQVFSEREARDVAGLPPQERLLAFYRGWTRKEAYAKARGVGLRRAPDEDPNERSRWWLQELDPGPGYVGAVAVEAGDHTIECWDWTER